MCIRDRLYGRCRWSIRSEMADEVDELRAKLARADHQIALLEATIRDRSNETARINHTLRMSHEFFRGVYRTMPGSLFFVDDRGLVEDANDNLLHLLGAKQEHVIGMPAAGMFVGEPPPFDEIAAGPVNRAAKRSERALRSRDGRAVPVLFSATALQIPGERKRSVVCVALDISDRKRIEAELRQSQKLESVGRLAAGVAHEINTPVQFVSDNVQFVRDAIADLFVVVDKLEVVQRSVLEGAPSRAAAAMAADATDIADLPYLAENVPKA